MRLLKNYYRFYVAFAHAIPICSSFTFFFSYFLFLRMFDYYFAIVIFWVLVFLGVFSISMSSYF